MNMDQCKIKIHLKLAGFCCPFGLMCFLAVFVVFRLFVFLIYYYQVRELFVYVDCKRVIHASVPKYPAFGFR